MSAAKDIAEGRISPADLDRLALEECRALFGHVAGPEDPLWELHVDIARQVLALDVLPYNELAGRPRVHRDRLQPVPEGDEHPPIRNHRSDRDMGLPVPHGLNVNGCIH